MKKTFERELPEGYKPIFEVDAMNKKFVIWANVVNILIVVALLIPYLSKNYEALFYIGERLIHPFSYLDPMVAEKSDYIIEAMKNLAYPLGFLFGMIAYIILHELTHGVAYKLLTKEKLKFGLTLTVAYCGVPNIYVYRKPALISLLAPFTVFTILFLLLHFLIPDEGAKLIIYMLFSLHIGGCVGDLYDTILYLTKLKDNSILMKDSGPKQVFYSK